MKKLFTISLALFWSVTVVLLMAGLVVFELQKNETTVQNGGMEDALPEQVPNTTDTPSAPTSSSTTTTSTQVSVETTNDTPHEATPTPTPTATATVCTSFTYSAWGSCQSNGTQRRTVVSSVPSGCVDGAPVTTQACTYTPVVTPKPAGPTKADVATHTTSGDCWLIISNKVYNVTQYIPFHPGGQSRITNNCGTDATTLFTTSGNGGHRHSSGAYSLLAKYFVGDLQ